MSLQSLAFVCAALLVAGRATAQTSSDVTARTHVIMLGTGNPIADPERSGPATVIVVDSTAYLVDAGAGVMRRWVAGMRASGDRLTPSSLRTLFVTHLHSDHTLGYADLIFTSWTLDQRNPQPPLRAYGPPGLKSMTDHLLAAYAEDIRIRTGAGGERAGTRPPQVDVHEITPGIVYRDSLVTVTAFAVHHGTWEHAFGYRFQTPDKDIVISGDAAPPSTIPAQCHGCDILIHEGGVFSRDSTTAYRRAFHTSMEDIVDIARVSRPKLLVLYHLPPGPNDAGLKFIRARYAGEVVAARDLDVLR